MLFKILEKTVDKYPHNIIFKEGSKLLNYENFMNKVLNYNYILLNDYNIQKNDRVMIVSKNSSNFAALHYSIIANKGITVPTYPNQSLDYYKKIIKNCQPKLIFSSNDLGLGEIPLNKETDYKLYPRNSIDNEDIAALMHTSGTSSNPKGVKLTHSNIFSNIISMPPLVEPGECSFSFLPWSHCFGFTCELNYMIYRGGTIKIVQDNKNLINELKMNKPEHLFTVPQLLTKIENKVLELPFYKKFFVNKSHIFGDSLKNIAIGGSSTPISTIKFLRDLNINVFNGYGLTETSPLATLNTSNSYYGSVGKPISDVVIKILDDGEITISGPNVMKGYWGFDDHDGEFKTGDLGYLDEQGYLYITGRKGETYKLTNGKFINPTKIQNILLKNHNIEQIFIYGINKEYNIALVNSKLDENTIMDYISNNRELNSYEKPKKIIKIKEPFSVENNLLTPKLSLKRNSIYDMYKIEIERLYK
jgi:long-chain acyl-CoA synthetase